MRIVHFAPFAPNRAGIYEAARDMLRADAEAGHEVAFVDVGCSLKDGSQEPARVSATDDRGGFSLTTSEPSVADSADVLVLHSGVPDSILARTQAPVVWIVHGRPLAAFRNETPTRSAYSLIVDVAKWPRSKALVYFWPEFTPYWSAVVEPAHKLQDFDFPPIDGARFSPEGPAYEIPAQHRGRINGLICDSWREDIDTFEIVHGAIEAARRIPGLVWHLYAMERTDGQWRHLIQALGRIGALGEVRGREPNMEQVYRSMDLVLTPHRIVTRVIGEALRCGVPVVAGRGCRVTDYTAAADEPERVASAVQRLVDDLEVDADAVRASALSMAERFDLDTYGLQMTAIYQAAVGAGEVAAWH